MYLWFHCCSVAKSCLTLCDPIDCSMPCFPVLCYLPELAQTHVHWVDDAIQPSHPVAPFFSCAQSFPASGSFPMSWFFTTGGQSIGIHISCILANKVYSLIAGIVCVCVCVCVHIYMYVCMYQYPNWLTALFRSSISLLILCLLDLLMDQTCKLWFSENI